MPIPRRKPTQNKHGLAHLSYFSEKHKLSFIWSQVGDSMVEVCKDRYGGSVVAVFRPPSLISVLGFAAVCEKWIEEHPDEF